MWTSGGQIDLWTFAGMRGGGKGGGSAAMPTAQTYSDPTTGKSYSSPTDLNAAIDQRNKDAADKAASDKAAADLKAQTDESNFQTRRTGAYNDAMTNIMNTFKGAGVDPANYMDQYINPALTNAKNSVPDLSTDMSGYFPGNLGSTILNQATSDRRTNLLNQLNQTFTPSYAMNAIPESTLDAPINSILSQQFDPLSQQLTNAQKRGTLTDAGYQAALNKMNQNRTSATSTLRNLGETILNKDRSGLDTLANSARSDISGSALGQAIDPASYGAQASSKAQGYLSDFPGALQAAAGDVSFSNIQDLLNAGGSVQGANNPTASNPMGTGAVGGVGTNAMGANDDLTKRGLGTTGAF